MPRPDAPMQAGGQGAILWRRLDVPGHDACRLEGDQRGWRVEGAASFLAGEGPAWLVYTIECDLRWRARRGQVRGRLGSRAIELEVSNGDGVWLLNGVTIDGLAGCIDLDLGFTPATNLIAIRRLALAPGQAGDVRAAWLDVATGALQPLDQRYERRSESAYWYQAPRFDYAAELDVAATGFIRRYPTLWEEERGATG